MLIQNLNFHLYRYYKLRDKLFWKNCQDQHHRIELAGATVVWDFLLSKKSPTCLHRRGGRCPRNHLMNSQHTQVHALLHWMLSLGTRFLKQEISDQTAQQCGVHNTKPHILLWKSTLITYCCSKRTRIGKWKDGEFSKGLINYRIMKQLYK
jgi:hypothetical protein